MHPKPKLVESIRNWEFLVGQTTPSRDSQHCSSPIKDWEIWLCYAIALSSKSSHPLKGNISNKSWLLRSFGYFWLVYAALDSPATVAQSVPPITPTPTPRPQPELLPPTESPLDVPPTTPPLPEDVLDVPGTITVEQFEFVGSSVFETAELRQAAAEFQGRPISFAQLLQAANKITELYIQNGYITSGAYIPVQNLQSGGVVKIQILEGDLTDIEVNIIKGRLRPSYIRSRIARAATKPLQIARLQEALQLLQLDVLIESLDARLTAGIRPGTNTLEIDVFGADTFSIQPRLNNNRNPSVGSFERAVRVAEANLLGFGDEISLTYSNTDGSDRYEGGYTLPINSRNGTLGFDFRISDNEIIEPPADDVDIDIISRDYNFTWRQPIIRQATAEATQEFALDLTLSRRESEATIQDEGIALFPGADDSGNTRTSTIRLAQEWLRRDRQQVFSARSQFNLGVDAFDATINDDEPDGEFFFWRGQFLYSRLLSAIRGNPPVGTTFLFRSDLQLATTSLLPIEQFSLGGFSTVRGYRQDALLADSGFQASAEVRLPIARVPQVQGILQIASFIDIGTGWNINQEDLDEDTLVGTGLSLIWDMDDRLNARFDWGIPLIEIDSGDRTWQENGIYLQMEYNFSR